MQGLKFLEITNTIVGLITIVYYTVLSNPILIRKAPNFKSLACHRKAIIILTKIKISSGGGWGFGPREPVEEDKPRPSKIP